MPHTQVQLCSPASDGASTTGDLSHGLHRPQGYSGIVVGALVAVWLEALILIVAQTNEECKCRAEDALLLQVALECNIYPLGYLKNLPLCVALKERPGCISACRSGTFG